MERWQGALGAAILDIIGDATAFDMLVDVLAGTVRVEEREPRGSDYAYVELLPYGMRAQAELGDRELRIALAELAAALFAGPSAAEAYVGVLASSFAAKEVPLEVRLRIFEWQPSDLSRARPSRLKARLEAVEEWWGE